MKRKYDFSKGVRGKFYRKGAELRLPIYLDAKLQEQLERLAEKNGKDVGEMVNQLVQKEVEVIQSSRMAPQLLGNNTSLIPYRATTPIFAIVAPLVIEGTAQT